MPRRQRSPRSPLVTSTLRHISFRRLGTSEVHQRFLEDDRDLGAFLGMRARNVNELVRRAPTGAGRVVPRPELAEALRSYAERHQAPAEVLANAEALLDPATHVIVTGQQPGLLGGPLFCLHKAATAIRLCREIEAAGGPRVVPLFWNHSDDHDLDEANRLFLVNQQQDVQRFRLDLTRHNEPLRTIGIGRELERLLAEVDPLLAPTEFHEQVMNVIRPRHPDDTFGDLQARMMFEVFGRHGLLVIEPRDLPAVAFEPLERWWGRSAEVRERVKQASDDLGALGVDITLDPAATMMFELNGKPPRAACRWRTGWRPAQPQPRGVAATTMARRVSPDGRVRRRTRRTVLPSCGRAALSPARSTAADVRAARIADAGRSADAATARQILARPAGPRPIPRALG